MIYYAMVDILKGRLTYDDNISSDRSFTATSYSSRYHLKCAEIPHDYLNSKLKAKVV